MRTVSSKSATINKGVEDFGLDWETNFLQLLGDYWDKVFSQIVIGNMYIANLEEILKWKRR